MIYNLLQYLQNAFPTLDFVTDGWENDAERDSNLIKQTGGDTPAWFPREDYSIQIMSRAKEKYIAHENINNIYHELRRKFGCVLPEKTVGSVTYPAITTAQISALQIPGYIGTDQRRLHLYSYNIKIVVGG